MDTTDTPTRTPVSMAWVARAACRGMPTAVFFPEGGQQFTGAAICAACPVRDDCREYGIAYEEAGVWGGLTERARVRERRKRGLIGHRGTSQAVRDRHAIIAEVAVAAIAAGGSAGQAVADHYKVRPVIAAAWIKRARQAGHDIPYVRADKAGSC